METVKHPGTILGAIDLIGLLAGWAYFQKQYNELRKDLDNSVGDSEKLKAGITTQFEIFSRQMHSATKNITNRVKSNQDEIRHLKAKISQYEQNQSEIYELLSCRRSKGDSSHRVVQDITPAVKPRTRRPRASATQHAKSSKGGVKPLTSIKRQEPEKTERVRKRQQREPVVEISENEDEILMKGDKSSSEEELSSDDDDKSSTEEEEIDFVTAAAMVRAKSRKD
jgi:hypothetical protein